MVNTKPKKNKKKLSKTPVKQRGGFCTEENFYHKSGNKE